MVTEVASQIPFEKNGQKLSYILLYSYPQVMDKTLVAPHAVEIMDIVLTMCVLAPILTSSPSVKFGLCSVRY